jgi:hypothetical protein
MISDGTAADKSLPIIVQKQVRLLRLAFVL